MGVGRVKVRRVQGRCEGEGSVGKDVMGVGRDRGRRV